MRRASLLLLCVLAGCYDSVGDTGDSFADSLPPVGGSSSGGEPPAPGSSSSGDPWAPTTAATGDEPAATTTTGPTPTTESFPDTTTTGIEPPPPPVGTSTTGGVPDDCPRVRITVPAGDTLNVRPTPSTAQAPVGSLASGAIVDVLDIVDGEVVDGNGTWYHIQNKVVTGYVWGGWVECTLDEAPTDGFFLPLACGMTATVSQGNFGEFSHQGQSAYAFDFSLGLGTPLVAIADGTVSHLFADTNPGDPCYNGGGQECSGQANYVVLLHGDGTQSIYAHLSEVQVSPGQAVARGGVVGLSGSTGWSTGRHAHVAREENCGIGWCQSIAVAFADVPGDGVPTTGDVVTSGNCP